VPIGYQHDHAGRIVKVADEAIRETLALIFSKFAELGSARQVTAYLAEEGVLLPHRRVNDDAVSWRRATYELVHGVLTNPSYAGVYAYGRSKIERRLDEDGRLHSRQVELPMSDWAVLIPNHHDGFIAAERECQALGGLRLEEHIVDAFLAALAPASIDATLAALHDTEESWQRECRQRELAVERAGYEAERAERQFTRVEPENRLVARSLESVWEQRLNDAARCQGELDGFRRRRPTPLSQDDAEWLRRAGSDLKAVWQAPTTTNRDRKHLLRCLISEIVVFVDRERLVADLTICWAGGASAKLNWFGSWRRTTPTSRSRSC
jgi:hypothetical protein